MVSSRNPGQRRTGGRRRSVKQSSHGPGGGGTSSPVAIPAASRRYIAPASTSSSSSPVVPGMRRTNHGCHPIEAGIGSSAWSSIRQVRLSAVSSKRWTTEPANGQSGPRSIAIVVASTACQGRSRTVPWMACGGIVAGRRTTDPPNVNSASRIRPAYGAIGNEPQSRGPSWDVLSSSRPSTTNEAMRPPATRSTTTSTPGAERRRGSGPGSSPGGGAPGADGSPGSPTCIVPPPEAATGASRSPLATISLTGGVERKICWSNPTSIPPMVWPTDSAFFLRCSATSAV